VDVVVFHDDKVLLARRAIEPARGMWDFPGGFSEAGETAEETAVREVLEETSLQVRVTGYLGSLPDVYGDRQLPILSLCFTAEVLGGEPHAQSDVADLAWFGRGDLPEQMAFAHQKQLVRWCKEGRGGLQ
jgi:ADP-ribose pyrophosphatase YjhB (NUDIX family)